MGRSYTGKETKNRGGRPHHRSPYWLVTGGFDFDLGLVIGAGIWYFDFWNLEENSIHTFVFHGYGLDLDVSLKKLTGMGKVAGKAMRETPAYVEGLKGVAAKIAFEGVEAAYDGAFAAWRKVDALPSPGYRLSDVDITREFGKIVSVGASLIGGYKYLFLSAGDVLFSQPCHGFDAGLGAQVIAMGGKWAHVGETAGPPLRPVPPSHERPSDSSAPRGPIRRIR